MLKEKGESERKTTHERGFSPFLKSTSDTQLACIENIDVNIIPFVFVNLLALTGALIVTVSLIFSHFL